MAFIRLGYEEKEAKEHLKSLGFKWHLDRKVWFMAVTAQQFDLLSKQYKIEIFNESPKNG